MGTDFLDWIWMSEKIGLMVENPYDAVKVKRAYKAAPKEVGLD